MISRKGFSKGEEVEFQNYQRCWVRGTVQHYESAHHRIHGPNGEMQEVSGSAVHVLAYDSLSRAPRIFVLNPKRVRLVHAS